MALTVQIKKRHLDNATCFVSSEDCPLALAIKEKFETDKVKVGYTFITVNSQMFQLNEKYGCSLYNQDKKSAELSTDPEEVIRTIEYIKNI
jgi:hypothetical protein